LAGEITGTLANRGLSIVNVMAQDDPIEDDLIEDDAAGEIALIETRLEQLAAVAERCRKIILASKIAIGGGIGLMFAMLIGVFSSSPIAAIGSIAAVLGGIVSLGSNVSTLQQTTAAIDAAEKSRSELIGSINLRVVGDSKLH
jgi:hypothetical protein